MAKRKSVLSDHKRVGSKLITPFNELIGPLGEVSWTNTIMPELLWIALLQDRVGPHRCAEILTAFSRDVRTSHPDRAETIWAAAGKYEAISSDELQEIVSRRAYSAELCNALKPLKAWYPMHPLNRIFSSEQIMPDAADLVCVKAVLRDLFDRSSWAATMTQAHAMWLAFDAGRLKVSADLSLAQFPEIDQYPKTELSRRIAGSIRASLNAFFGGDGLMSSSSRWPIEFWNHGLKLESCEIDDGRR